MLKIVEVKSEEHFQQLRQQEDTSHDYLYICKHNKTLILSDNGNCIAMNDIVVNPKYNTGTKIASIETNGNSYDLYIPVYDGNSIASCYTKNEICNKAQISKIAEYMTSSVLYNPLEYEYYIYKIYVEIDGVLNEYYGYLQTEMNINDESKTITVQGHTDIKIILTKDSIKGYSYSGEWYNIYITLIGYRSNLYDKVLEEYNNI